MNGKTWEVQHQCPQCGAPVVTDETDRLFLCPFCRVTLYLTNKDYLHYYLPAKPVLPDGLIYVPYWRFKGTAFFFEALKVNATLIDASASAAGIGYFPATLGLRPQTLRLKFITGGMGKIFLKRQNTAETVFSTVLSEKTFIGETISMIYSPFILKGKDIYDVFTERLIAKIPDNELDAFSGMFVEVDWHANYVATLCPDCGWNLEGEKDSCALVCKNCNSLWQSSGKGFERLDFASVVVKGENMHYLPFWRIKANLEGMELKTYADLVRLANLPKAIKPEWPDTELFFWVPAFKLRPELFLRIGRSVTIVETKGSIKGELPRGFLHPVTLPSSEAAESLKLVIADTAINKKTVFPLLKDLRVSVKNLMLIYLPFNLLRDEFQNPDMRLTINKNALQFGRNL